MQGEGSFSQGRGVHQLDAVRPDEEEDWQIVVDEEDDHYAFLGEEDDWREDLDGALVDGEEVRGASSKRGTPGVGHQFPTAPCRNIPWTIDCKSVGN